MRVVEVPSTSWDGEVECEEDYDHNHTDGNIYEDGAGKSGWAENRVSYDGDADEDDSKADDFSLLI